MSEKNPATKPQEAEKYNQPGSKQVLVERAVDPARSGKESQLQPVIAPRNELDLTLYKIGILLALIMITSGVILVSKEQQGPIYAAIAQVFNLNPEDLSSDEIGDMLAQQQAILKQSTSLTDPEIFNQVQKQAVKEEFDRIFVEVPENSQQYQLMQKVWALTYAGGENSAALEQEIMTMVNSETSPENPEEGSVLLTHLFLQAELSMLYGNLEDAELIAGLLSKLNRQDLADYVLAMTPYVEPVFIQEVAAYVWTAPQANAQDSPQAFQDNQSGSFNQPQINPLAEIIIPSRDQAEDEAAKDVLVPIYFRFISVSYAFPMMPATTQGADFYNDPFSTEDSEGNTAAVYQNVVWAELSSRQLLETFIRVFKPTSATINAVSDYGNGVFGLDLNIAGLRVAMETNAALNGSSNISLDLILSNLE